MAATLYQRYIPPQKSKSATGTLDQRDSDRASTSHTKVSINSPPVKVQTLSSQYTRYIPPRKETTEEVLTNVSLTLGSAPEGELETVNNFNNVPVEVEAGRARKRKKEGEDDVKYRKKKKRKESSTEQVELGVLQSEKPDPEQIREGKNTSQLRTSPEANLSTEPSKLKDDVRHRERREHKGNNLKPVTQDLIGHQAEDQKHHKTLEKRQKSLNRAEKLLQRAAIKAKESGNESGDSNDAMMFEKSKELHGLAPLPQPDPLPELPPISTLLTLPSWLSSPIRVSSTLQTPFQEVGLGEDVASALGKKGFKNAFAIQSAVLSLLLPDATKQPGDVLVSAATGSGKTMAYVLPMCESISRDRVTKLRGVIVVPTRDLVAQGREVCETCTAAFTGKGRRHVHIGTAAGNESIHVERAHIMSRELRYDPVSFQHRLKRANKLWESSDWGSDEETQAMFQDDDISSLPDHVVERKSKVDILICTPGRLVEHLKSTPGFTLEHLKWLVIDEADKLLDQSFQDWLSVIMLALPRPTTACNRLRKVILSATMTRDIGQLNDLKLYRPSFVALEESHQVDGGMGELSEAHTLPLGLIEHAVMIGDESLKPLYLLQLLRSKDMLPSIPKAPSSDPNDVARHVSSASSEDTSTDSDSEDSEKSSAHSLEPKAKPLLQNCASPDQTHGVLIFTNSSTSTLRLARLLCLLLPTLAPFIAPLTSTTKSMTRSRTLHLFAKRKIHILIASDLVSRGLDLLNLRHVVNYDVPGSVKAYVHRVGRTARAGKEGWSWTLLARREAGWFWAQIARGKEVRRAGKKMGRVDGLGKELREDEKETYEQALRTLGQEARG